LGGWTRKEENYVIRMDGGIEEREVIYEEKSFEDQLINKERIKTMGG